MYVDTTAQRYKRDEERREKLHIFYSSFGHEGKSTSKEVNNVEGQEMYKKINEREENKRYASG